MTALLTWLGTAAATLTLTGNPNPNPNPNTRNRWERERVDGTRAPELRPRIDQQVGDTPGVHADTPGVRVNPR